MLTGAEQEMPEQTNVEGVKEPAEQLKFATLAL